MKPEANESAFAIVRPKSNATWKVEKITLIHVIPTMANVLTCIATFYLEPYLAYILTYIFGILFLSNVYSGILSGIYSDILSDRSFSFLGVHHSRDI